MTSSSLKLDSPQRSGRRFNAVTVIRSTGASPFTNQLHLLHFSSIVPNKFEQGTRARAIKLIIKIEECVYANWAKPIILATLFLSINDELTIYFFTLPPLLATGNDTRQLVAIHPTWLAETLLLIIQFRCGSPILTSHNIGTSTSWHTETPTFWYKSINLIRCQCRRHDSEPFHQVSTKERSRQWNAKIENFQYASTLIGQLKPNWVWDYDCDSVNWGRRTNIANRLHASSFNDPWMGWSRLRAVDDVMLFMQFHMLTVLCNNSNY